jgi:hypothetical protein
MAKFSNLSLSVDEIPDDILDVAFDVERGAIGDPDDDAVRPVLLEPIRSISFGRNSPTKLTHVNGFM